MTTSPFFLRMLLKKKLFQSLPAVLATVEKRGLQGTVGEVESVIVRHSGALDITPPSGVLTPGQMPAIDPLLKSLLPELLRLQDARVHVPAIPLSLANVWALIAIDVSRREPSRAAAFVHIDAIMIIGQFEWIAVLPSVDLHLSGVLLHRLADAWQGHGYVFQEFRIISWPIAIVLIHDDGFFSGLFNRRAVHRS